MRPAIPSGVGSALAWFAFPLIPALLGTTYHQKMNGPGCSRRVGCVGLKAFC